MKKFTLVISTTCLIALIAASAYAWGPGKGRGGYGNMRQFQDCPVYNGQNQFSELSKEQQDQLAALRQSFIDDTYELRSEQMEKRQQIRLLLQTSTPDKAKLTGLYEQIDALKKKIREKQIDMMLAAKKIAPDFNFKRGFNQGGRGMGGYGNKGHWGRSGGQRGGQRGGWN